MKIEDFLSPDEESEIVDAITTAENHTSGEIRVHLEKKFKGNAGLNSLYKLGRQRS